MNKKSCRPAMAWATKFVLVSTFIAVFATQKVCYAGPTLPGARTNKSTIDKAAIKNKDKKKACKALADFRSNNLIENKGQIEGKISGKDVQFYGQSSGVPYYVTASGISYCFSKSTNINEEANGKGIHKSKTITTSTARIDMELVGANNNARIIREDKSLTKVNYYGSENRLTDLGAYGKVRYVDVYPKIDMVLYHQDGKLKYDFVVNPGGDPSVIKMKFNGQNKMHLGKNGSLAIFNGLGSLSESKPYTYQSQASGKIKVKSSFLLSNNIVSFYLGTYDKSKVLTIDPTRSFGTYYGGVNSDEANDITIDKNYNLFITGRSSSLHLQVANTCSVDTFDSASYLHWGDAFVASLTNDGSTLNWFTYFGGKGDDAGESVAVDADLVKESVYITGGTTSSGIATAGAYQTSYAGPGGISASYGDAFIAKFDASCGSLTWSTYFGGPADDYGYGLVLDNNKNIYICGLTASTTQIAGGSPVARSAKGVGYDGFVAKFSTTGTRVWATYYGGNQDDYLTNIDIDGTMGYLYMSGYTESTSGLSTAGAFQTSFGGGTYDAFALKLSVGDVVQWCTYYGGTGDDWAWGIATDMSDNVVMVGTTATGGGYMATSGAFQTVGAGGRDGFIVKFSKTGTRTWASYLGGGGSDFLWDVASDGSNFYTIGYTNSSNFPMRTPTQGSIGGTYDVSFTEFCNNGKLVFSTYLGGSLGDYPGGVICDDQNNVYFSGYTNSTTGIATSGAFRTTFAGADDIFVEGYANFNPKLYINDATNSYLVGTSSLSMISSSSDYYSSGPFTWYQVQPSGPVVVSTSISFAPSAPGYYYLTATTPCGDVIESNVIRVDGSGACTGTTITSPITPGTYTFGAGTYYIPSSLVIQAGATVTFNNATIIMGKCAFIELQDGAASGVYPGINGASLTVNNSGFHGCNSLWEGIDVAGVNSAFVLTNEPYLEFNNVVLNDAVMGIYSGNGRINIKNSTFENNNNHITAVGGYFTDSSGAKVFITPIFFGSNTFKNVFDLSTYLAYQCSTFSSIPNINGTMVRLQSIEGDHITKRLMGQLNSFTETHPAGAGNITTGIYLHECSFDIFDQNTFQGNLSYGVQCYATFATDFTANNFQSSTAGTPVTGMKIGGLSGINVTNHNNFTNLTNGIEYYANNAGALTSPTLIKQNLFSQNLYGVVSSRYDYPITTGKKWIINTLNTSTTLSGAVTLQLACNEFKSNTVGVVGVTTTLDQVLPSTDASNFFYNSSPNQNVKADIIWDGAMNYYYSTIPVSTVRAGQTGIYVNYGYKTTCNAVNFIPGAPSGCTPWSHPVLVPSGIDNATQKKSGLNVFPNPSEGSFTIHFSGDEFYSGAQIQIFDELGRQVYNGVVKDASDLYIHSNDWEKGVYNINTIDNTGQKHIARFMKL